MSRSPLILVVDDDLFVRRPLELILRDQGFCAATAGDGGECLARIAESRPDLIILDIMMPGPDGFEVCQWLKDDPRYAEIPILLLSARDRAHDRERGLALGAEDYLTKPYSPFDLVHRIRKILDDSGRRIP